MSSKNKFKCYLCGNKYTSTDYLYNHLEGQHREELGSLSPKHWYFDMRNHNTEHIGHCVICKRPTHFNETTGRYERFDRDICKEKYREQFVARMKKTYGKTTLLNDPDQQKKMLANRKISGEYKWQDGGKSVYTGTYELDCFNHLEKVLGYTSKDVIAPAPMTFKYIYKGKNHFYIPDFYIPGAGKDNKGLLLEIKGSNKHYRDRDIQKEHTKDAIFKNNAQYDYIKILDKNYKELDEYLNNRI